MDGLSNLLQRIAGYFSVYGGKKNPPKMEMTPDDLREIAALHVEKCKLQSKLKESQKESIFLYQDFIGKKLYKVFITDSSAWIDYGIVNNITINKDGLQIKTSLFSIKDTELGEIAFFEEEKAKEVLNKYKESHYYEFEEENKDFFL